MTTFVRLAAVLVLATNVFGAVESALAAPNRPRHSVIRDHRGPSGAPSGGITVDGRKVDMKPPRLCFGGGVPCPRPYGRGLDRPPPVVHDHRLNP